MSDTTPCIRCGKMRIVAKTWTEVVNMSKVTYTQTVCPDRECQKIVDEQMDERRKKLDKIKSESLKRKEKNIRNKRIKKKKKSR